MTELQTAIQGAPDWGTVHARIIQRLYKQEVEFDKHTTNVDRLNLMLRARRTFG